MQDTHCQPTNAFQFLRRFDLTALARTTGFVKRTPRKITPEGFLGMLLAWSGQGYVSWRLSALQLSLLGGAYVSKVGLFKRSGKALGFVRALVEAVVSARLGEELKTGRPPASLAAFKRVILQDSTCVSLHPRLARAFPGASNQRGAAKGSLRIQASFDVLTQKLVGFTLASFRDNDQKAASDLSLIRSGDLLIRDLGYFVLRTFAALSAMNAFFLSRYRHDILVFDPLAGQPIDLLRHLRKYGCIDRAVLLGKCEKVPVRIIAVKLPAHVAGERRRKAKADRDKRKNPSKAALALLGWAVYVTNVPTDVCSGAELVRAYALRWQIEIIFKAWKSHLRLNDAPAHNPATLELWVYARLLMAVLIQQSLPRWRFLDQASCAKTGGVSLLKLYSVISQSILLHLGWPPGLDPMRKHDFSRLLPFITYEHRGKRKNMMQKVAALG